MTKVYRREVSKEKMICKNEVFQTLDSRLDEFENDEEFEKDMEKNDYQVCLKTTVPFSLNIDTVSDQFYEELDANWYEDMSERVNLKDEDWHILDNKLNNAIKERYDVMLSKYPELYVYEGINMVLASKKENEETSS